MTNTSGLRLPSQRKANGQPEFFAPSKKSGKSVNPLFVGSVEKSFSILNLFVQSNKSLSLTEIANNTGMGKSSAQRFCHTLVELGYLERDRDSKRMRPSVRLMEFSFSYLSTNPITSIAAPYLLQACESSGEAVNLGLPIEEDIIYIARLPSAKSHLVNPLVGGRAPMFCTSSGRAYLSTQDPVIVEAMLKQFNLTPLTKYTITDPVEIMKKIEGVTINGFTSANEECIVGELSIAAPILRQGKYGVGAINICVTKPSWSMERVIDELSPIVCRAAHDISQALSN